VERGACGEAKAGVMIGQYSVSRIDNARRDAEEEADFYFLASRFLFLSTYLILRSGRIRQREACQCKKLANYQFPHKQNLKSKSRQEGIRVTELASCFIFYSRI
jgi:hypothetical protein